MSGEKCADFFGFLFLCSGAFAVATLALCMAVFAATTTYRYVLDGPLVSTVCTERFMGECVAWKKS